MVYMDSSWYGFGVAKSSDGINWIKQTASAPFFQSSNTLWAQNVRYPNIVLLSNGFRIYYGGSTGAGYQGISFFDNYSFQTIF